MPSRRDEIAKEAKQVLDRFASALSKIKDIPESFIERDESMREEAGEPIVDEEFRKIFFDNAPEIKDDCIQAEKGKWK